MCSGLDKSTLNTNTCYRDDNGGSNWLLPIMELVFVYKGVEYRFNVFIDSGSERSYLADSLQDVLNCRVNKLSTQEFVMKTFLGSARKLVQELKLFVKLPDAVCSIPFLVDKNMDLTFKVKELCNAVFDMQACGCKLTADFSSVRERSFWCGFVKVPDTYEVVSFHERGRFRIASGICSFWQHRRFPTCSKIQS